MKKIVFIGDSILDWFNCAYYFPDLDIANHGIAGDTISGVLNRINRVLEINKPETILVMIGHNDLCMGAGISKSLENFSKICNIIKREGTKNVFISGLLPIDFVDNNTVQNFNAGIESISMKNDFTFIPVREHFLHNNNTAKKELSDGLHLTGKGYDVLAEIFKDFVYIKN